MSIIKWLKKKGYEYKGRTLRPTKDKKMPEIIAAFQRAQQLETFKDKNKDIGGYIGSPGLYF